MLELLLLVAVAAVGWVCVRWWHVKQYWAQKGVPFDPPHPILGSLTFLQKLNPAIWMRQMYDRFKAPYVGIWLFWRPALLVQSPQLARRILVKDFECFRNRLVGSGIENTDPVGGYNIFCSNDPLWTSLRKRLTPMFTSAKLKSLYSLKSLKSKELIQRIDNDQRENKSIELRSMFADYTTDIIGVAAFGIESQATLTKRSPLRSIAEEFMQFNLLRGISWCGIFFLPEVVKYFRSTMFSKSSIDYLRKVYRTVVNDRGGYTDVQNTADLVDTLRKFKFDADKNGEDLPEDVMVSQGVILLQAGFDTSATTLAYLTYELAFCPEAQEKLYEELLQTKERVGEKAFDANVFADLPYMNALIKETLRKYPPLGWLDRVAVSDYKVDDKLTIPAGTTVYVNAIGMHFDPQYYPEPEKFDPDRFLPENEANIEPFTYMPFGEGPRSCIGKRFAFRTMWYAISALFLNYRVRPRPGSKRPVDCEIENRGLVLTPAFGLHVDFIPRQ